jgi:hypothetical protein
MYLQHDIPLVDHHDPFQLANRQLLYAEVPVWIMELPSAIVDLPQCWGCRL